MSEVENSVVSSVDPGPKQYSVGTLLYTRAGLFHLFFWLLWGDFTFSLMDAAWSAVLPLDLRSLNVSNTLISLLTLTIPQVMNFVLNPIISTISDRHRGSRGRRIPFLLFAIPFVAVFLVAMGFSRQISSGIHALLNSIEMNWLDASTLTVAVISVIVIGFRFFELFIDTTYWYLFNDVVPSIFLGRFLGLFRVVGMLSGALFNFFVFRYAESHSSWIYLGAGILYGGVFTLMCLNVKEGTYPPPDPMTSGSKSPWAYLKAYGTDCFSHRMYILLYLSGAIWSVGSACVGPFNIFWLLSLGLNLDQVGKITAVAAVVTGLLSYPAGMLVDKIHPIRVQLLARSAFCLVIPINLIYLFINFPPSVVFWLHVIKTAITVPLTAFSLAAGIPLLMRTLPHERYGQFGSANAMVRALSVILGGALAGLFLDLMKRVHSGSDYYYRYLPVWQTIFAIGSLVITWMLYKEWQKLGGDTNYRPPNVSKAEEL